MTDYEREYQLGPKVCGDPFAEFVRFFDEAQGPLRVLDLGCGQGRDALMAARRGHIVHGVDCAATGIRQMLEIARAEGLSVTGETGDVGNYQPDGQFDVVIIDRVLHMLPSPDDRRRVVDTAKRCLGPGGAALIADTQSNRELIREAFDESWNVFLARGNFTFARRNVRS